MQIQIIKYLLIFLFVLFLNGCSVPGHLKPDQQPDARYKVAFNLIEESLKNIGYEIAKPRSEGDILNEWLNPGDPDGVKYRFYERKSECECKLRILVRLQYWTNKNYIHVNFSEFNPIFHTNDGRKTINKDIEMLKHDLETKDMGTLAVEYRKLTVIPAVCMVPGTCSY